MNWFKMTISDQEYQMRLFLAVMPLHHLGYNVSLNFEKSVNGGSHASLYFHKEESAYGIHSYLQSYEIMISVCERLLDKHQEPKYGYSISI